MTYRVTTFAVLLVLLFVACKRSPLAQTNRPAATNLSTADISKLRWIEGTWRGSGVDQAPFFERYRFENASTLAVDSFPDEKLDKVEETSRFELRDGRFGNGNYVASSIDDKGIDFEPVANAKNSFRWERVSDNAWKATLKWPAEGNKPARERVYNMERIQGK
ncbi:MAG TPA: hypothetical protein VF435_01145 [Pyrinomonadaceae bacterium]